MRPARGATFLALASFGAPALAHGSARGLGPFLGGALHPVLEPAQLMALVALGVFAGQRGLAGARPVLIGFLLALLAGLLAAGVGGMPPVDPALLVLGGLLGVAVIGDVAVPRALGVLVAGLVGLGVGMASEPESVAGQARLLMLLGSGAAATVGVLSLVGLLHEARRPWQRIGMRVVGSWIAASAILVVTLWVAGKPRASVAAAPGASPSAGQTVLSSQAGQQPVAR